MKHKDGVANIVRDIGAETRRRIRMLPKTEQTIAWATVASAITAAGIHDSPDPDVVVSMVQSSISAMLASTMLE